MKKIMLLFLVCCCLLTSCGTSGGSSLLWEIPLNTGEDNAAAFQVIYEQGGFPPSTGLHCYTLSEDRLFLEDSANQRILIINREGTYDEIPLDENFVCTSMIYVSEEDSICLLGYDMYIAEPQLEYYKADLTQMKLIFQETASNADGINMILDAEGNMAPSLLINYNENGKKLTEFFHDLTGLDGMGSGESVAAYGGRFLCQYSIDNKIIVFWAEGELKNFGYQKDELAMCGQVKSYSDAYEIGNIAEGWGWPGGAVRCAGYYKDGKLHITYMAQTDENTLGIFEINMK